MRETDSNTTRADEKRAEARTGRTDCRSRLPRLVKRPEQTHQLAPQDPTATCMVKHGAAGRQSTSTRFSTLTAPKPARLIGHGTVNVLMLEPVVQVASEARFGGQGAENAMLSQVPAGS